MKGICAIHAPGRLIISLAAALSCFPSGAFAQTVWRHGMVQAKSDAGFVFMAQKGGFAKKLGLDLKTMQFKGDAIALKALIAGDLDSYEGSPGSPLIAASRGADVKAVGCYWPGLNYDIMTKKDVASPKDLKGKTFAISSPGALPDLFARAVLKKYKISASDVHFAVMGSDADRFRALSAGVVGAAAVSSEFTPLARKFGLKVLARAHDVTPKYLRFCIYMSGKTIATRTKDAAKFLAAEIEALRFAVKHRNQVIKLTQKMTHAKADDPRAVYIAKEAIDAHLINPEMPVPQSKLAWMEQLFMKTGNLKTPVDLSKFIDTSVLKNALAIVGPPQK